MFWSKKAYYILFKYAQEMAFISKIEQVDWLFLTQILILLSFVFKVFREIQKFSPTAYHLLYSSHFNLNNQYLIRHPSFDFYNLFVLQEVKYLEIMGLQWYWYIFHFIYHIYDNIYPNIKRNFIYLSLIYFFIVFFLLYFLEFCDC